MANAATVLVIVLVEALNAGGRLPRAVQLWELRVLVMGIIGRLRCFSPPTAALVLDLLARFWRFLGALWPVPALEDILEYLENPATIKALRKRLKRTAREPRSAHLMARIEAAEQTGEREGNRTGAKTPKASRGEAA